MKKLICVDNEGMEKILKLGEEYECYDEDDEGYLVVLEEEVKWLRKNRFMKVKEKKYLGKKPNAYYVQKQIAELEQMVEICLKNNNLQKATKYGLEIQKLKEQNYGKL